MKTHLPWLTLALLVWGCSDNSATPVHTPPPDSSTPIPSRDAGGDSGEPLPRSSCLERPGALPRPPGNRLPCELIPPGMTL